MSRSAVDLYVDVYCANSSVLAVLTTRLPGLQTHATMATISIEKPLQHNASRILRRKENVLQSNKQYTKWIDYLWMQVYNFNVVFMTRASVQYELSIVIVHLFAVFYNLA